MTRLYVALGMVMAMMAFQADSRGWLGAQPTTITNVPTSIRDNPGAYRSLYQASPRAIGGK